MRLYDHERSSAAFRVRIALNLKGCRYERVPVAFPDDPADPRIEAYRAVNPQGFVPALEHDGLLLTQSLAIIEYLDACFPDPRLVPAAPVERVRVPAVPQTAGSALSTLTHLHAQRHHSAWPSLYTTFTAHTPTL